MTDAQTQRRHLVLPGICLSLFGMLTLFISGCGESATPEEGTTAQVIIKKKPETEAGAPAAKQPASDPQATKEPALAAAEDASELRLPGLPNLSGSAAQQEEREADSAPQLSSPSSVLAGEHPPLKRQPSKFEQRFDLAPAAEEQPSSEAATVQQAHRVIDLRKLKEPAGAKPIQASPTQVSLTSTDSLSELKTFYERQLKSLGWEPVKSETAAPLTDEYGQLEFTKDGFQLGVTLSRYAGSNETSIGISNYGNLNAQDLPSPPESQKLFGNAMSVLYITAKDVATAADECIAQLEEAGWQAYQHPYTMITENNSQRTLTLKKNGIGLSVYITVAPAQQNQTSVQYSLQMLGDDLPAPQDAQAIEFLESPLQLSCDTTEGIQDTLSFYREALTSQGWQETGEANQQPTEAVAVFQREEGLPIVLRLNRTQDGQNTNVAIAEFEMPQDAPAEVSHQTAPASPITAAPATEYRLSSPPREQPAEEPVKEPAEDEDPLFGTPAGEPKSLPGVLPGMMTFEDWLKKHNYQPSPERLNQFAKEMEEIANRSADILSKEPAEEQPETKPADNTPAGGLLPTLSGLPRLTAPTGTSSINLQGAKIDAAKLKDIAGQPGLTDLNLSDSTITDQDLPALLLLTRLKSLNLSETGITDAAIPQLIQIRSLQNLDLRGRKNQPCRPENALGSLARV